MPWWQTRRAIGLAAIIATVPLWFVQLPPLIDLLGHIGRYHIQLAIADSPVLRANWAFEWRLLGNLGGDLLMELLGRSFGVERGAGVLAATILLIAISGMARLARAAHGHIPATAWAAFPFAAAYPWQYGLVNYCLGIACALHAAASLWHAPKGGMRLLVLALVSFALWVVHIYGWAVFAVLMAARAVADRRWTAWAHAIPALLPLGAPLIVMAALNYGARGAQETYGWFLWLQKLDALMFTLRDQSQLLDMTSLAGAIGLIGWALGSRLLRFDRGLGLAALMLLGAVAVIPYQALGSAFADGRLWPVVFIVAILAIRVTPQASLGTSAWIAGTAAAVFTVRIAASTVGFFDYDAAYARHLSAFERIERGPKIAVFAEFPCNVAWRRPRTEHLDGIVIARHDAFTNGQWDVPGAQLLMPLGARGTRYNADPSQLVRSRRCPADLRPELARRIATFPRDRFGYVWVTGFAPDTLPRYPGLIPVFADEATILYRVER